MGSIFGSETDRKSKASSDKDKQDTRSDIENRWGSSSDKHTIKFSPYFHSNPINFANQTFEDENDVFVTHLEIDLKTVIQSYTKSIRIFIWFCFIFFYNPIFIMNWKNI